MRTRLVFLGCATVMLVVVVVAVCVPRREEPLSDEALARLTGATPPINYCETCQECVGNNPHCSDDSGCTSYTEGRACPTVTSDTTVYGAKSAKTPHGEMPCVRRGAANRWSAQKRRLTAASAHRIRTPTRQATRAN